METKDILKDLRKSKGFSTMQEFCSACNISFSTYQNYETGKRIPTAEILMKLADFYGVTTDYLLGREPLQYSIEEQELITKYNKLDEYGKQVVNNAIEYGIERQDEDTRNIAAAFRMFADYKEKYGFEKAIELMEADPFANLDLRDEYEKEVLAKYMSLPADMRAMALELLRQLGGVVVEADEEESSILTRTTTTGEFEDQWKAEQEAEKDGGKSA